MTANVKKGAFVLTPIVPLSNIMLKPTQSSISFGSHKFDNEKIEIHIMPISKPQAEPDGTYKETAMFQAYFWIASTSDKSKANHRNYFLGEYGGRCPLQQN